MVSKNVIYKEVWNGRFGVNVALKRSEKADFALANPFVSSVAERVVSFWLNVKI